METEATLTQARSAMVAQQLIKRGIKDAHLLKVFEMLPRHKFIDRENWSEAYKDHPVPIGFGQTISQPFIVAFMTQKLDLKPDDCVLEIGTGCGYQTAILASLCKEVYSIELVPELLSRAQRLLEELGFRNVKYHSGNGALGWPEPLRFNAILCAAAPKTVPHALTAQLADGGRMIIPVGDETQDLVYFLFKDGKLHQQVLLPVRFVPMI